MNITGRNTFSLFIVSLLFCCFLPVNGQVFKIRLEVTGYRNNRAYIATLRGDDVKIMDSTIVNNGSIIFNLDTLNNPGVYRIFFIHPSRAGMFDRDVPFLDFIFNRENVYMLTSFNDPVNDMVVKESQENDIYFHFLKLRSLYRHKLGLLLPLAQAYLPDDEFFPALHQELLSIQKAYDDSLLRLAGNQPGRFVSSLILFQREPIYDPVKYPDLDKFMQENFFKPVNFNDARLINSPEVSRKIISYLSFFRNENADQQTQENEFIRAVDVIMDEVNYNEAMHEFVLNYLINGFERFQMERVLVHIADNHLSGECKTESEEIVRERLEAYKNMAPGNTVPDINLLNPFDEPKRLSDMNNQQVLLIFWSSECPHCSTLLPRLAKWYREEKGQLDIGIYGVSIDKDRIAWEEFVLGNDLRWTNVYDPEGWESKTSRKFNLYATPTMFLLDSDMKIIAKPMTFREFKNEIEKDSAIE